MKGFLVRAFGVCLCIHGFLPVHADVTETSTTDTSTTFAACYAAGEIDEDGFSVFNPGGDSWQVTVQFDEDHSVFGNDELTISGTVRHTGTPHQGETSNSSAISFAQTINTSDYDSGSHVIGLVVVPTSEEVGHDGHLDAVTTLDLVVNVNNGVGPGSTNIGSYTFKVGAVHTVSESCEDEPICAVPVASPIGLAALLAVMASAGAFVLRRSS